MTVTYTISREDLKKKRYKQATVKRTGEVPNDRRTDLLVTVLKKVAQR